MAGIHVLDEATINQIAAGEVIERPASIVKELVENAIDAGASAISVEIAEGGIELIRITDNGCGIEASDVPKAFLRHATSKIRNAKDLSLVTSLGFRGEALSSIAAVARVEVLTKTVDALTGLRYVIEGGREVLAEEIAAVPGTTIKIEDLFFNTPARRKFLKKPVTEAAYITEFMQKIALGHPEISFQYLRGGKRIFHTSGDFRLENVLFTLYGREVLKEMIPVEYEGDLTLRGYISRPQLVRSNRTYEHFFLNGRIIRSGMIERVLLECYKDLVMPGSFPIAVLHLQVDPQKVDVNVHPTKLEVRFSDEAQIRNCLYEAILGGMEKHDLITRVVNTDPEKQKLTTQAREQIPAEEKAEKIWQESVYYQGDQEKLNTAERENAQAASQKETAGFRQNGVYLKNALTEGTGKRFEEDAALYAASSEKKKEIETLRRKMLPQPELLHWVGQIFSTYWLFEADGLLYMMDQHAAHERVLYDQIRSRLRSGALDSQILLEPQVLRFSPQDLTTLEEQKSLLEFMGFDAEPFGEDAVIVRCVPYIFSGPLTAGDLQEMVSLLTDGARDASRDLLLEKMAMKACKAAVKGNHAYSLSEARALYDSLYLSENPLNCPHGRPTLVTLSREQMEKLFKRIVM